MCTGNDMQLEDLSDLFEHTLELAWDCEEHLAAEFPKLADAVKSDELRHEFLQYYEDSAGHIARLQQVFAALERSPAAETSTPVRSMISEAGKMINHIDASALRDATLIFLANQAGHYKIALYGSACAFARALGRHDLAVILEPTLERAHVADRILTTLAEGSINPRAADFHNTAPFVFI
jgi:ferritin-like metal-binding protein YciE